MLLSRHDIALHAASQPLDGCGTRGAKRFPMRPEVDVIVDGERSRLVNLSITGAQLVLPARVQPRQSMRVTLVEKRRNGGSAPSSHGRPSSSRNR